MSDIIWKITVSHFLVLAAVLSLRLAMVWRTTEALLERRDRAPKTQVYVSRRQPIDYGTYVRYRRKLHTH